MEEMHDVRFTLTIKTTANKEEYEEIKSLSKEEYERQLNEIRLDSAAALELNEDCIEISVEVDGEVYGKA